MSIVIRYYAPPAVEKEDLDVIDDYNSDSVDYSAYGSSSGELEGSDSSPSSEEDSSDDASARNCNGGSLHLCPHSASMNRYRQIKRHDSYIDDFSSESSKGSITYSSNEEEDASYNIESSDEISNNEADVGSAKQFYIEEKCRGSVLKEKKREHIPLLRAMAIGLEDYERQDNRFKECVENGFVTKKDTEILKRHLYAEASRRSSGSLKALSSWNVSDYDLEEYPLFDVDRSDVSFE